MTRPGRTRDDARLGPAVAVCFDLDDTLYDYADYARAGLREAADVLADRTGESHHDELLALYFDDGVTEGTFDRLLERHGLPADLVPALVEAFHDASGPLSPYPETRDVLSELEARYPLGLVTDGRNGLAKLRRLGIESFFDVIVVAPAAGLTKREVEAFERALEDLSVAPGEVVHVGDDPRTDVRVPNRMGMETVRLRRGRHADREPADDAGIPDAEIEDLRALLDLLEPTETASRAGE